MKWHTDMKIRWICSWICQRILDWHLFIYIDFNLFQIDSSLDVCTVFVEFRFETDEEICLSICRSLFLFVCMFVCLFVYLIAKEEGIIDRFGFVPQWICFSSSDIFRIAYNCWTNQKFGKLFFNKLSTIQKCIYVNKSHREC